MAIIRISDLVLRTVVGINDWEKTSKQDVIINIAIDYDASKAIQSDDIKFAIDYKALKIKIMEQVETSHFNLIEKLADVVLKIVMADKKVQSATVRVDKPQALRFARSVSVELSQKRENKT